MRFDHRKPKKDPIFMGTQTAAAPVPPQPTQPPKTPKVEPTLDQLDGCSRGEKLTSVFQENPSDRQTRSKLIEEAAKDAIAAGAVKASDSEQPVETQNASVLNAGLEEDVNGPAPKAAANDAPSIGPAPDDQTPAATGGSRFNLGYLGTSSEFEANEAKKILANGSRFTLNNLNFAKWWMFHHDAFEYDLNYQQAVKPTLAQIDPKEERKADIDVQRTAINHYLTSSALANFSSFELKHDNTLIAYTKETDLPIKLEKDKTVRGALPNDGDYNTAYFLEMARLYAAANAPKGETAEARGLTFALNTGELSKDTPRAAQMVLASVLAAREQGINPKIILSYKDPTIPPETLEGDALAEYLKNNKDKLLETNPETGVVIDTAIAFAKNPIETINQRLDAALKPAPVPKAPAPEAAAPVAGTTVPDANAVTPENVNTALQGMLIAPAAPTNAPDNSAVLRIAHDTKATSSVIALPDQSVDQAAEAAPAAASDVIALGDESKGDDSKPADKATRILIKNRHDSHNYSGKDVPVSPPVTKAEDSKPFAPKKPLAAPAVHRRP